MITPAAISALNTQFSNIVQGVFKGATPQYKAMATETTSNTAQNIYGFVDQFPAMKRWLGPRTVKELKASSITLVNGDYEDTVFIKENDYDDENLGLWPNLAQALAEAAIYNPDVLTVGQFVASFSEPSYDGKNFFAVDHSWKGGTYSNKLALQLDETNYALARKLLRKQIAGGDNPLTTAPLKMTLICGPENEEAALKILNSEYNQLMQTNIYKGTASLLVHDLITDNKWGIFANSFPIKPWIYQKRQAPRTRTPEDFKTKLTEEKLMVWGIDTREAAGKLLWQLAVGSDPGE